MEAAAPPGFMVKRGARGKTGTDLDRAASLTSPGTPSAAAGGGASVADDAPHGFDRPLSLSASVASFQRRCEWFYVDPAGDEHGPVPLHKIINWHKKGHFPDDVKVRCRSPWPLGGSSSWAPEPPANTSSNGSGDDLHALFIGDVWPGSEPVWYYLDRSDQVQGPFRATEMIGWVSSGMLKDDTKMCGAEPKLGIPPGRSLYQPLSELLAMVRRGEPYRPANLDSLRRKATTPGTGAGLSGSQPPPPPPPPRRADSIGEGFAGGFGPPGRASDAPTWRKDVVPPSSSTPAAAGVGGGGAGMGSAAAGGVDRPAGSGSNGIAEGGAGSNDRSSAGEGHFADLTTGAGAIVEPSNTAAVETAGAPLGGTGTGRSEEGGASKASTYHNSNAAALSIALSPDQDFEYGDDFKKQRQQATAQAQAQRAAAAKGGAGGRARPGSIEEQEALQGLALCLPLPQ
eukprot:gene7456-7666_t